MTFALGGDDLDHALDLGCRSSWSGGRPVAVIPTMRGWNLALRFCLEVACLLGLAVAGWMVAPAVGLAGAVVAAGVWGVFAVPDDPSRSGRAPVPVNGWVRLLVELVVFVGGAAAWLVAGRPLVAAAITVLLLLHHVVALPRLRWLLAQRAS
jgi:hypothetical protein